MELQIPMILDVTSKNINELLMQFSNLAEIIEGRDEILRAFGLDEINSSSSETDIKRYNKFRRLFNKNLKALFKQLEMKDMSRKCEELLAESKAENASTLAIVEQQSNRIAQLEELIAKQSDQISSLLNNNSTK